MELSRGGRSNEPLRDWRYQLSHKCMACIGRMLTIGANQIWMFGKPAILERVYK